MRFRISTRFVGGVVVFAANVLFWVYARGQWLLAFRIYRDVP